MEFTELLFGVGILIFLIWLFNSVYVIKEWERGVILRLGRMLPDPKPAGLQLVFFPIEQADAYYRCGRKRLTCLRRT